ncbi:MAG TPA: tRNA (adenosine(37)-N6)-threonylcarbamoyltransferase complex dimerization subunit type 1 TsaB [Caulobacteraceae bacterium]|nr:tRNA (adenosine(37)-N6)-threonylcarbamoyltransferase complex dimerization subunit type 1 TsaB [Caulobacteraceae bacterium]
MRLLVIDTALACCTAALAEDGRVTAARAEPMLRGHQERLAGMVEELMREAGADFAGLDRIGVTVGPGSFTGLRVGLAFAKGLGAALQIPVAGVESLAALADSTAPSPLTAAVIDARRDQIYAQFFRSLTPLQPAEALTVDEAVAQLINIDTSGPTRLVGPGAALLAERFPKAVVDDRVASDPAAIVRLAALDPIRLAEPLYLRTADAKLPA